MTHLRIEQNNILENVSSAVIEKLYKLATSGDLDLSSNLAGNLHTTATYLEYIDALCKTLLNPNGMFPDLTISTDVAYLRFEDPEVLDKLKIHIGDGVGVPITLFRTMTTIPATYNLNGVYTKMFWDNENIVTFNELAQATNCTVIGDRAFDGCSNLELIDISNIRTIGNNGFRGCSKCVFIGLNNITNILEGAFSGCASITGEINLLNLQNTNLPTNSLNRLSNVTSIVLPNTITSIGEYVFYGNTSLTTVSGLSNVTTLGSDAFNNCNNITTIDIDWSKLTNIGENVFRGCSSLGSGQTLELNLTNQTSYPLYALYGTAFTRLILHSPQLSSRYDTRYPIYENMRQLTYLDLSDWRPGASSFNAGLYEDSGFYNNNSLVTYIAPITANYIGTAIKDMGSYTNARYFILLNTTPPSIHTTDQNNPPSEWFYDRNGNVHIYVPDSAVSAYLNDSAWSTIGGYNGSDTISDRLHGLSELPAGVWTTGLASQYLTAALLATS